MKKYIITICLLSVFIIANAQQANKTLVKTLNIDGVETLFVDLDGEIIIETWDRDNFARVQIGIIYENASTNMMIFLISKGRYNLSLTPDATSAYKVNQPNYKEDIQINKAGNLLIEKLTYTFFVPTGVNIVNSREMTSKSIVDNKK